MKIISYNVNGIRAAIRKGLMEWLRVAQPDVLCLQETKARKDQIDSELFTQAGYPYHYWFSAEKKGYSGVAIFCKQAPNNIAYGTGIDYMDKEGRNLRIDYDDYSIMSLYVPSGTNDARLDFKLKYMADFQHHIDELKLKIPHLIICGDYNICHRAIDIHNPQQNKNTSGFLPVERKWLDNFINKGFVDSFRYLNPNPHHYSWWSYRANARHNNKGWRIDYHLITENLLAKVKRAYLLPEAKHSDHCPVVIELG